MHLPTLRPVFLALAFALAGIASGFAQVAPVITTQPQSVSVNVRAPATFTVGATGSAPLFYQWFFNGTLLSTAGANNAQAYLGINSPTLTAFSATAAQAGVYTVAVSNGSGGVLSAPATLTVVQVPEILSVTGAGGTVGLPTLFFIAASNSPTSYQVTNLPPGLALNSVTGEISGTPTKAGTYNCLVTATNSLGTSGALAVPMVVGDLPSTFTLLAGGPSGSTDGLATSGRFNQPGGIAVDAAGNLYVADSGNHTIRKVTPAGVVTTLAGLAGQTGPTDGTGNAARFNNPTAVALDAGGNLYVTDTGNQLIRKISATGAVSTLAGVYGQIGANDGPAASARFSSPRGIAVDTFGNVVVADSGNSTIRQISLAGTVTTLAGAAGQTGSTDGPGVTARFSTPTALAVDVAGSVLVLDTGNFSARKISGAGLVSTIAQGLFQKDADIIQFLQPTIPGIMHAPNGMTVDGAGNLYLTYGPWSFGRGAVVKVSPDGTTTSILPFTDSRSNTTPWTGGAPNGIAVASGGIITVAVASNVNSSTSALYIIAPVSGPAILTQPQGTTAAPGQSVGFGVIVGGLNPANQTVTYQWQADGVNIPVAANPGAVGPFLTVTAGLKDVSYTVLVSTQYGVVRSNVATLSVFLPPGPTPVIVAQPHSMIVNSTGALALSVTPGDTAPISYQWRRNGVNIPNATGATLLLGGTSGNAVLGGDYTVVMSRAGGSVTSAAATLTVGNNLPSRIANLSVRTNLASGQNLIVGFVTSGPKNLLLRAVGPGLNTVFGLPNYYADPSFTVINAQGAVIDQNNDWSSALSATFASVGAFPLTPASKDAATARVVSGPNTAVISGAGSGVMLVELYDAESLGSGARVVNVSARNQVGTGGDILISGFVIDGTAARTVLVRGIGPGLHDNFGVNGFLPDPVLEIHQTVNGQDTIVASNDNWDASLTPIFDQVGAYHFTAGSKDAALVVTLPPGIYTAQVSGAASTTGDGVVEVYVVP